MTLFANSGLAVAFAYYMCNRYVLVIPNKTAIPAVTLFGAVSTIACSFMYAYSVDGISVCLCVFMLCAGCVGNLMYQILYPFLVSYREEHMIAARAGNDFVNAVIAFVALWQDPGASPQRVRFLPSTFILCVGIYLLVFPPAAFWYILTFDVGLRRTGEGAGAGAGGLVKAAGYRKENTIVDGEGNLVDIEVR